MVIREGVKAPDFKLEDKDGNLLSLPKSDFTILYFYPRDSTPGCTTEALEFSSNKSSFEELGSTIIGISGGDNKSKAKFCEKNKLSIDLVSDTDYEVCTKYGVYGEKQFMGKKFMGIVRTTFILDKDHNVLKVYENVKVKDHVKNVLADLEAF